ncbi:LOB domain-containing protein 7-like isoform X2 [Vicia villosa]|uniref:LOB domain-containing protein 7-like isoform X2 n=1 Tax=Vicia villosa TaxID=3911 RepID=UPI00273AAA89|nr:LOB domain-containing protein 7-like isoform X2 [Vicia villosa]
MNINISRNNNSNGGTPQACSACKYQRRKCGPTCILAPYFPHERQKQFLNAHKLFGVGKITNMLKNVPPESRDVTMSTIVYQADMRALDPVGGCYRHIQTLQAQIDYFTVELHFVLQQLAICRAAAASSSSNHHHYNDIVVNGNVNGIGNDDNNNNINHNDDEGVIIPPHHYQHQQNFVEEQLDDVNMFQPQQQQQMQPQYVVDDVVGVNPNYVPLQEDLNTWVNSIPLSPLTLQDNKKEEDEVDQEPVGDNRLNDDQKPVFDLSNEMNSSDIVRAMMKRYCE